MLLIIKQTFRLAGFIIELHERNRELFYITVSQLSFKRTNLDWLEITATRASGSTGEITRSFLYHPENKKIEINRKYRLFPAAEIVREIERVRGEALSPD